MRETRMTIQQRGNAGNARKIRAMASTALMALAICAAAAASGTKSGPVFFPEEARARLRANAGQTAWGENIRRAAVDAARPWLEMSDEGLWDLMFGATITRSWMVWSNGHCPSCKNPVPMYSWKADALKMPWKMACPHCGERFPKNDFQAFYRSGLDGRGVFDPGRADRGLLFNSEHPRADDPLRLFGVDDGNGFVDGADRWRFIGTYLIYGQWKQAVLNGIVRLSLAYVMTGEPVYARKAVILLDRVADLYPTFDFKTQAIMYEGPAAAGYVSTWHDACEETRLMALAYDQVFDIIGRDPALQKLLKDKAAATGLENRKETPAAIRRNIEERILEDAVANRWKIRSNYPRTETAVIVIQAVLGWPDNRAAVTGMIDDMVQTATAVDGVTGEKGLAGYASSTIANLAYVLGLFDRIDPGFLEGVIDRHPSLKDSYRFHFDTWFRGLYYPQIGDTGGFGQRAVRYAGANFLKEPSAGSSIHMPESDPSAFTFFMRLYDITRDPAYVQILFRENGETVEGLPFDLLGPEPTDFQGRVKKVIDRFGSGIRGPSFDKRQWHLAMLRSGNGEDERALWIDYDSGGSHGHADGMNVGLFAKGLDLLPDLGYPPVHFGGGWEGAKALWYRRTAAHNTVVIDGKDLRSGGREIFAGRTTFLGTGSLFRAIRVSGAEMAGVEKYDRTLALVDVSDKDSYVLDLFRVRGGTDHVRYLHGFFGAVSTSGLNLEPLPEGGFDGEMRAFRGDPKAKPGWSADWKIEDRYGYLAPGAGIHLRLTDLTNGAEAAIGESWISIPSGFNSVDQAWIPKVAVRRRLNAGPLDSTFVGVIEPYETRPLLKSVRRLPLNRESGDPLPDGDVALEMVLADGRMDLAVSLDRETAGVAAEPRGKIIVVQKEHRLRTDAGLCLVRLTTEGRPVRVALGRGTVFQLGDLRISADGEIDFIELDLEGGRARLAGGAAGPGFKVILGGQELRLE